MDRPAGAELSRSPEALIDDRSSPAYGARDRTSFIRPRAPTPRRREGRGTMDQHEIQRALDAFAQNPREAQARIPDKRDKKGHILRPPTAFSREDIKSLAFVVHKDAIRQRLYTISRGVMLSLREVRPGRVLMEASDDPANLVDSLRYDKPSEIDAAGLASAELKERPWSSDYWPTYLGILGRRYHDPAFPGSKSWKQN